eukprot:CAMPEP_0175040332 /NCGR_PEP_ID=MMETSP0052_2-20121109/1194_1 /TAXON_ID=51329 ORGANISM="Polytomella parva, Strain SAG 63-3" /NCGR_SAMPLE_ID=MMETSP0052_2 /ASSEMBLY_ACC=CAM_ASM_000194 /LENGTH=412 /DNA_ID=CAMNT_0016302511 /DNA_START=36 /DNA_END=1271 /DNA_ORIENTATION=-
MSTSSSILALRREFERMKKPLTLSTNKPMKVTDYLLNQVEALQGGFTSLCDSVLREMEDMRNRNAQWEAERQQLLTQQRQMTQQLNDAILRAKILSEFPPIPMTSGGSTAGGVSDFCGSGSVTSGTCSSCLDSESLLRRTRDLERGLLNCRSEVQLIRNQMDALEWVAHRSHLPLQDINERLADSTFIDSLVSQAVVEAAPALVARITEDYFPNRIQEKIEEEVKEQVDSRVIPFQCGVLDRLRSVSDEITEAVKGVRKVESDVTRLSRATDSKAESFDQRLGSIDSRVCLIEKLEKDCPRTVAAASMSASTSALSSRLSNLESQHSRFSKGVEGILKVLVDDGAAAATTARAAVSEIEGQKVAINDTRNALETAAAVFAQLLNVPSPLPRSTMRPFLGANGGGGRDGGGMR